MHPGIGIGIVTLACSLLAAALLLEIGRAHV